MDITIFQMDTDGEGGSVCVWGGQEVCAMLCCCCSVAQLCLTLCDPLDCSTSGFPVLHHLPEFAQTNVH